MVDKDAVGLVAVPALVMVLFIGAGAAASEASREGAADCEFIHDADARYMCRAVTKDDPAWCSYIRDNDLRHMCYARVKKARGE